MDRVYRFKTILWLITGIAAAVATARFMFGLGATTNLSDSTPWGFWIGFDVMSGVALAAGGFIITASVYIFKREEFHPIVRPAVLTAFLGYIAVAVGLLFDLGLPWNIWHMTVYWNHHSALFEVGWCVMLYLTVLALEFFPVPMESFPRLAKIRNFLVKFRMPLVVLGIMLSTLHQSSLGSLFLIMPYRVHPLWYSNIIPIMFFISAVALGLMMVTFESLITTHLYRRKPETELLAKLGVAARWVLLIYLAVRFTDLGVRGQFVHLFEHDWRVIIFWIEIAISAVIPIILLFMKPVRTSHAGQWVISVMTVTGIVLNRLDVGGLVHLNRGGPAYVPAWTEIAISAGVVAAAALVFLFAIEHFNLWEKRPADPEADPAKLPEFDKTSITWLGIPLIAARIKYSLVFVLSAAIGFGLLSSKAASTRSVDPTPSHRARGADTLWIDGNIDGYGTSFKHAFHIDRLGGEQSCTRCHHANLPRDKNSGCYSCHSDMYRPTDAFKHEWHSSPTGAGLKCLDCHEKGVVRSKDSAKKCDACHSDLIPENVVIKVNQWLVPGYADAMHDLCIGCHRDEAIMVNRPELPLCVTCHKDTRDYVDNADIAPRYRRPLGKRVVVPSADIEAASKKHVQDKD